MTMETFVLNSQFAPCPFLRSFYNDDDGHDDDINDDNRETNWQAYFFFKRPVSVAESMEIMTWMNASWFPAKSII